MTDSFSVDVYVADVLMRDLVGHDRRPSAFLVYLWLWRNGPATGRETVGASLQNLATRTGLSKSAVQEAVRHLVRRGLVTAIRSGPTDAPLYYVKQPWRR